MNINYKTDVKTLLEEIYLQSFNNFNCWMDIIVTDGHFKDKEKKSINLSNLFPKKDKRYYEELIRHCVKLDLIKAMKAGSYTWSCKITSIGVKMYKTYLYVDIFNNYLAKLERFRDTINLTDEFLKSIDEKPKEDFEHLTNYEKQVVRNIQSSKSYKEIYLESMYVYIFTQCEPFFDDIIKFILLSDLAPFTITCDEEMLMQLLLIEKDFSKIRSEESFSIEQLNEELSKEEKKIRENKYLQQAEEGFIRKFIYK